MDATEQAIDQTMRLTLSGAEYVLRLSGTSAARLSAALWSVATTQQKASGKARLASLLKSGKELKVFNVTEEELSTFAKEAKRYGVLYAVIKGTKGEPSDLVDIMVKAEDAAKINRIVERLEYGRFDETSVVVAAERDLAIQDGGRDAADRAIQTKPAGEILRELLGDEAKEQGVPQNPTAAKTASPAPSAPSSDKGGHQRDGSIADKDSRERDGNAQSDNRTSKTREGKGFTDERERPSVKQSIAEKRAERTQKSPSADQPAQPSQTVHQAPASTKRKGTKTNQR